MSEPYWSSKKDFVRKGHKYREDLLHKGRSLKHYDRSLFEKFVDLFKKKDKLNIDKNEPK